MVYLYVLPSLNKDYYYYYYYYYYYSQTIKRIVWMYLNHYTDTFPHRLDYVFTLNVFHAL
jgi:hypothetical protein